MKIAAVLAMHAATDQGKKTILVMLQAGETVKQLVQEKLMLSAHSMP